MQSRNQYSRVSLVWWYCDRNKLYQDERGSGELLLSGLAQALPDGGSHGSGGEHGERGKKQPGRREERKLFAVCEGAGQKTVVGGLEGTLGRDMFCDGLGGRDSDSRIPSPAVSSCRYRSAACDGRQDPHNLSLSDSCLVLPRLPFRVTSPTVAIHDWAICTLYPQTLSNTRLEHPHISPTPNNNAKVDCHIPYRVY